MASPTTALTPAQRLAKRRKKATSKPAQTTASGGPGGRTTTGARRGPRGNAGDSVTMSRRTSPDPRALSAYARRQGQSQKPKSMDPRAMSGMARGYGQGNVSGQMLKNAGVAQARNQYGAGAGPGGRPMARRNPYMASLSNRQPVGGQYQTGPRPMAGYPIQYAGSQPRAPQSPFTSADIGQLASSQGIPMSRAKRALMQRYGYGQTGYGQVAPMTSYGGGRPMTPQFNPAQAQTSRYPQFNPYQMQPQMQQRPMGFGGYGMSQYQNPMARFNPYMAYRR